VCALSLHYVSAWFIAQYSVLSIHRRLLKSDTLIKEAFLVDRLKVYLRVPTREEYGFLADSLGGEALVKDLRPLGRYNTRKEIGDSAVLLST
jgi:hypothetical protein